MKTQQQRDAAAGELSAARSEVPNLHQELASTRSHHADAMAKADAEIERLTALAEKLSVRGDAKASAPAAAAELSSDGEENSEVDSAGNGSVGDGESGDGEDEGSVDDGELAAQEASAKAADELAKGDPVLADKLKKIDAAGKLQYRTAHGRGIGEASSSDDGAGPARSLAQGGAKSLQLGQSQHTRLDRGAGLAHQLVVLLVRLLVHRAGRLRVDDGGRVLVRAGREAEEGAAAPDEGVGPNIRHGFGDL